MRSDDICLTVALDVLMLLWFDIVRYSDFPYIRRKYAFSRWEADQLFREIISKPDYIYQRWILLSLQLTLSGHSFAARNYEIRRNVPKRALL